MILVKLAELIYKLITSLLSFINLPSGDEVFNRLYEYTNLIISNGKSIFLFFVPEFVYKVLLPIAMAIFLLKYAYYLVLWIINKIPALKFE